MKLDDVLALASEEVEKLDLSYTFKGVSNDEQIVYGEVYAPYILDTHQEMMLPDDIKKMAHDFFLNGKYDQFDVMHDNKVVSAKAIESFIARDGDPDFTPGSWVLGVKVMDAATWKEIKAGNISGFSLEAYVTKREAIVEIISFPEVFGYTEKSDGHDHVYFVKLDAFGKVIGGHTSKAADGHFHVIKFGTATEDSSKHSHRFFLP
jgi:hypothetical protein